MMIDIVLRNRFRILLLALLCVGCTRPDVGPALLEIDTQDEVYQDYVIQSAEKFSRIHGGYAHIADPMVVSSGETIEIAMSRDQPNNLTGFSVDATHPAFRFTWTGVSLPRRDGAFSLPTLTPERWSTYLAEHEVVDYVTVISHLGRVLNHWVPTIGAESGARLSTHMALFRQLKESAVWTKKDESHFATEADARAELLSMFKDIERLTE